MYELNYDPIVGIVRGIIRHNVDGSTSFLGLNEDNADYQAFFIWNKAQKTPLDLNSTIEPFKPEPARDFAKEIGELQARQDVSEKNISTIATAIKVVIDPLPKIARVVKRPK